MISGIARFAAGVFVLMVLAGCGGGTSPPSPTVTPPMPTSTPVEVRLGPVVWASNVDAQTGAPVDSLTTLPNTASAVYAVVQTEVLPPGAMVQAHWTIDGAMLPELEPAPIMVDAGRTDAWISWSLTWTATEPWPVGTLGVVIEVDGETKASSDILIVRAGE